jgi:hypothetical protein
MPRQQARAMTATMGLMIDTRNDPVMAGASFPEVHLSRRPCACCTAGHQRSCPLVLHGIATSPAGPGTYGLFRTAFRPASPSSRGDQAPQLRDDNRLLRLALEAPTERVIAIERRDDDRCKPIRATRVRRSESCPDCGRTILSITPGCIWAGLGAVHQQEACGPPQHHLQAGLRFRAGHVSAAGPGAGGRGRRGSLELTAALLATPPTLLQPLHQPRSRLLASPPPLGGAPLHA